MTIRLDSESRLWIMLVEGLPRGRRDTSDLIDSAEIVGFLPY